MAQTESDGEHTQGASQIIRRGSQYSGTQGDSSSDASPWAEESPTPSAVQIDALHRLQAGQSDHWKRDCEFRPSGPRPDSALHAGVKLEAQIVAP
jgi:hypothetical protein